LLYPQWLTTRGACTISYLPWLPSSPRPSRPSSLARWGIASAARLCSCALSACPPPPHGSP